MHNNELQTLSHMIQKFKWTVDRKTKLYTINFRRSIKAKWINWTYYN